MNRTSTHWNSRCLKYFILFCNSITEIRMAVQESYQFQVLHTKPLQHFTTSLSLSLFLALHFFPLFHVPLHHLSFSLFFSLSGVLSSFPPCCILSHSLQLSSPPPHMSVCSKLEQRLNRGSETWRECLSEPGSAVQTQTHAPPHTHTFCLAAN